MTSISCLIFVSEDVLLYHGIAKGRPNDVYDALRNNNSSEDAEEMEHKHQFITDLMLSRPSAGQGVGGETRTCDRGVPADLRVGPKSTMPPMFPLTEYS
ncbi:hypothetical protein PoB_004323800 [Plakobranchus ocellatus]|uniref:Uncharacterized protein n=1 Tax=Plakobranchus ocellatus TaxID=259542 RepID=A0AAV4BAY7_9GAST|nr:hypothetical protein PoB_004323800 [Plakobranchus ocellatus]